jgi:thiol-disulfide isomerase/thioredoxin
MDRRQVISLVSLGIVGAGVGGLVLTSGDNDDNVDAAPADTVASPAAQSASDTTPVTIAPVSDVETVDESPAEVVDPDVPDLSNRGPHPEFLAVQEWLQTDATSFDAFDGKVRAVQFWTFGCRNCQATWPHMRELHEKYAGENFEIIGVHAPEFDFERDPAVVASKAQENGLVWPIAIDNKKLNFRSWQERRFWPRLFLIDADGNVRYDKIGEGKYDEISAAVGALIAESQA